MRSDSTPVEYVLRSAEEQGVRFVRLWFVDVLGLLKSSSIPISELEQALTEGVGLDGSSLESGTRLFELDAIAHPDPTTFELLPWRPDAAVARMFCDIKLPDGTPSPGDSREALRRQLRRVAELGYSFQVGPEIEFFLFESKLGSEPPTPLDEGSYFDQTPLDDGSDFRRATIQYLEQMGIPIKASHHEVGASQHEMDLKHTDALTMADAITTFRLTVKEVAREVGPSRRSCRSRSTACRAPGCISISRCSRPTPAWTRSTTRIRRRCSRRSAAPSSPACSATPAS